MNCLLKKLLILSLASLPVLSMAQTAPSATDAPLPFPKPTYGVKVNLVNFLFNPTYNTKNGTFQLNDPSVALLIVEPFGNVHEIELRHFNFNAPDHRSFSGTLELWYQADIALIKHPKKWDPYIAPFITFGLSTNNFPDSAYVHYTTAFSEFGVGLGLRRKLRKHLYAEFGCFPKLMDFKWERFIFGSQATDQSRFVGPNGKQIYIKAGLSYRF